VAAFLAPALLVLSCSSNPATGKKQLNFYSEAQEIELGREADRQISAQLGVVDDPELQAWVSSLGKELAAKSERPELPWSFKVMDDPIVNAFALPGGFIYVTRGLLGHLRNEAELATVLGHEIGHVTARHGVNQMSKAQLAQGGLIVGAVLAGPGLATDLAQTGLGLLFLKYGRDDERQADDLGLRYMSSSGYDPHEMPGVFEVLRRVGELQGAGRIPSWLSSHPDPGARAERAAKAIAGREAGGEVDAETYLDRTDGLVFGSNPRQGYFEGRRFVHPEMAFAMTMPAGWAAANEAARVVAVHPDRIAQVDLQLASGDSPQEAARAFLGQQGLTPGSTRTTAVNGLSAVEASFVVPRQGATSIVGQANFVAHRDRVFQLTALAVEEGVRRVSGEVDTFLSSFGPLTDSSALAVQPQRVRVERLASPMSFEEFLRRHPSDERPELLALINGIEDSSRTLPAGTLLKRIDGRKVGTQRIEAGGR
jgi:predicted Zn-dependent protease